MKFVSDADDPSCVVSEIVHTGLRVLGKVVIAVPGVHGLTAEALGALVIPHAVPVLTPLGGYVCGRLHSIRWDGGRLTGQVDIDSLAFPSLARGILDGFIECVDPILDGGDLLSEMPEVAPSKLVFLNAHPDDDEVHVYCDDPGIEIFSGYVSQEEGGGCNWHVGKTVVRPLAEFREGEVSDLLHVIEVSRVLAEDEEAGPCPGEEA